MEFDFNAAMWVNTAVAKMVYAEKDRAASIVSQARCAFEEYLAPLVATYTQKAKEFFDNGDNNQGISALTELAMVTSEEATKRWTLLWQQLLVTNADGYVASSKFNSMITYTTII
jgi:hypothetical protein